MKSVPSAAAIFLALAIGAALGAFLSRPPKVHAIGSQYFISVQKVHEGNNAKSPLTGSQLIGFACTQEDCYVASTD